MTNLPLHGGNVPRWLFQRMVKLSKTIVPLILEEYGLTEFLQRTANPYWFQAFSCVIGFDWHSSGTTTTSCGALKMAIDPEEHGLACVGGKGKASRKTPVEILEKGELLGLGDTKIAELIRVSKVSAKVDNALIQDSYQLYHHSFLFSEKGEWTIIQQGMGKSYARRYQWSHSTARDLIEEPHNAISCDNKHANVLDMTSQGSDGARQTSLDLIKDNPNHLYKYIGQKRGQSSLDRFLGVNISIKEYTMPAHHPIYETDLNSKDWDMIQRAYEIQPTSYEELICLRGMGAKKIRALALLANFLYGEEISWKDPVKYAFSHGGKDGFPFPVERDVYDHSIQFLRDVLNDSKIGQKKRISALKKLDRLVLGKM